MKKGMTKPDSDMHARYRKMRVNGKQVNVARYRLEQKIGRPLEKFEYVHHVNGNKLDDRPENLELVTPQEHAHIHNLGRKASLETRAKISRAKKGKPITYIRIVSEATKKAISETMKRVRRERFWSTHKKSD